VGIGVSQSVRQFDQNSRLSLLVSGFRTRVGHYPHSGQRFRRQEDMMPPDFRVVVVSDLPALAYFDTAVGEFEGGTGWRRHVETGCKVIDVLAQRHEHRYAFL